MNFLILCSGLEPSRNGIGDYSYRFAEALRVEGHEVYLVSFNESQGAVVQDDEYCLRLGTELSWSERIRMIHGKIKEWQVAHVFLQYSPYAFHPKGFAWRAFQLFPEHRRFKLSVMIHENWIGGSQGASIKDRVVGRIQRMIFKSFMGSVQPDHIFTTNPTYQKALSYIGFSAKILKLFGNIPIVPSDMSLNPNVLRDVKKEQGDLLIGVIFGSIHAEWNPLPLLDDLKEWAGSQSKKLLILSIGKTSTPCRRWDEVKNAEGVMGLKLGELDSTEISHYLQSSDFGIATTPWALIGKSGSVAAMLDHGLPVIVNRDDHKSLYGNEDVSYEDPLLYRYHQDSHFIEGFPRISKREPRDSANSIAVEFLNIISREN